MAPPPAAVNPACGGPCAAVRPSGLLTVVSTAFGGSRVEAAEREGVANGEPGSGAAGRRRRDRYPQGTCTWPRWSTPAARVLGTQQFPTTRAGYCRLLA